MIVSPLISGTSRSSSGSPKSKSAASRAAPKPPDELSSWTVAAEEVEESMAVRVIAVIVFFIIYLR